MKSHVRPLFTAAVGVLLAAAGRSDQNLTGNTVVEDRLGVGLPVTSPVTVPLANFQVNGAALLRAAWPSLAWQDSATGQAFATRYINGQNVLQHYWDPAWPSGDNRVYMSVAEDLGITFGSDWARGFNVHVRGAATHNGALGISSEAGRNPGVTFMGYDYSYRTSITMDEFSGTHALKFVQLTLAATPVYTTVMGLYPNATGANVAIGGAHIPQEKLDVAGNIKASGTISAANPTAATHVVTLDWLKTQSRIPERGDISMGEFTAGPVP